MKAEEQIIIGALLRGDHIDTLHLFDVEDFKTYGTLFYTIQEHHKAGLDLGIVEIARDSGTPITELAKLITVGEIDFAGCSRTIKAERLKGIVADGKAFTKEYDKIVESKQLLEDLFNGTTIEKVNQCVAYMEELDKRSERKPIGTGLTGLDDLLGGFRPGELTTIAARPGVGKSAFCLAVADNAVAQGKKVLFFALEMASAELYDRITVRWSDISSKKLRQGSKYFSDKESKEMVMLLDSKLKSFSDNVWIENTIANVDLFKAIIQNEKPDLVIIDQLSCLRTSKPMQIRERYCYCTTLLKRISVELNVAVLLAAQIGRSGEGKKPTMADLKESSSIEEDSDNVILVSLKDDDEEENIERKINCELAKHRQGGTGFIKLIFVSNKVRFYEVTK
jgi:replicative DNA helicase